jgi:hypothetical protein
MGNTLSCGNLPATIPGAIPIFSANRLIWESVGLKPEARKLFICADGMSVSRAKALASFSFSFSSP